MSNGVRPVSTSFYIFQGIFYPEDNYIFCVYQIMSDFLLWDSFWIGDAQMLNNENHGNTQKLSKVKIMICFALATFLGKVNNLLDHVIKCCVEGLRMIAI